MSDWGDDPRRHTVREVVEYLLFLVLVFGSLVVAHQLGLERAG